MATIHLPPSPYTSLYPISTKTISTPPPNLISLQPSIKFRYPILCCFSLSSSLLDQWHRTKTRGVSAIFAVVEEDKIVTEDAENEGADGETRENEKEKGERHCELYVCNLPRSFEISELLHLFKPFGIVISVEVCRNPETGVSRGCGYVTMDSIHSAKKAISELDRSEVGGRELSVRFAAEMKSERMNPEVLNSKPKTVIIYESPYKLYVGNLAWSVKLEELRNQFTRFGTVVSVRVLYDRKGGKNRAYGFVSFQSIKERDAALSLDGQEFHRRELVVRKGRMNEERS